MPGVAEAAKVYQSQYAGSPAEEYLSARGLGEGVDRWLPGYVGDSVTGHEKYLGHLVIPYRRPAGHRYMATIRFRCIRDECVRDTDGEYYFLKGKKERHENHGKYQSLPADRPRLYNTSALITTRTFVALVEGELSSWAVEMDGIPAVAVQGVSAWKDHFDRAFAGFERVFIIGDGDEAGQQFNRKVSERLPNGIPIQLPAGEDADSMRRQHGDGVIRQMVGLEA
jgi:DNA primase